MKSFISFCNEEKSNLIGKLETFSFEQKTTLIKIFKKYNNIESWIDWNKKDLNWEDFYDVLTWAMNSKACETNIQDFRKLLDGKIIHEQEKIKFIAKINGFQSAEYISRNKPQFNEVIPKGEKINDLERHFISHHWCIGNSEDIYKNYASEYEFWYLHDPYKRGVKQKVVLQSAKEKDEFTLVDRDNKDFYQTSFLQDLNDYIKKELGFNHKFFPSDFE